MKTAIALALTSLFTSLAFSQPASSASNVDIINSVTDGKVLNNKSKKASKQETPASSAVEKSALNSTLTSPYVEKVAKCDCEPKKAAPIVHKKIVRKSPVKAIVKKPVENSTSIVLQKEIDSPKVTHVDAFNPPLGKPEVHNFDEYKKWQTPLQPNELSISVSSNDLNNSSSDFNQNTWRSSSTKDSGNKHFTVEVRDLRTHGVVNAYDFKPFADQSLFKVYVLNNHLDSIKSHNVSSSDLSTSYHYNSLWKTNSCSAIHILYQLKSQDYRSDIVKFIDANGNISDTLHSSCRLPTSNVRDTTFQLKENAILNLGFKEPYFNDKHPLKYQLFLTQNGREFFDVSLQSLVLSEDLSKLYLVNPQPSKSGPYHGVHYEQNLPVGKYRLLVGPVNDDKSWLNTSVDIMSAVKK